MIAKSVSSYSKCRPGLKSIFPATFPQILPFNRSTPTVAVWVSCARSG